MSSNPFADHHLIYAVVIIILAAAGAGTTWGLGKLWARLPFVRDNGRLRRPQATRRVLVGGPVLRLLMGPNGPCRGPAAPAAGTPAP
ncbi:hypothetical protein AB0E09_41860 [Streptomyces mirabilis]|nr:MULTISPECIES: hypothetical protein [Streptomyces]